MTDQTIQRRAYARRDPPSLLEKIKAYQSVIRDRSLTPTERLLLIEIVDSTVGRGKPYVATTMEELAADTGLSASTVKRSKTGLERLGLLVVHSTGRGGRYQPTGDEMPGPILAKSRRQRALELEQTRQVTVTHQIGQRDLPDGPEGPTSYTDKNNDSDSPVEEAVPPPIGGGRGSSTPRASAVEQAIASVTAKRAIRRNADTRSRGLAAVERTWKQAHADSGFDAPVEWIGPGSGRWGATAKNMIAAFPGSANDLHAFVEWIVANWGGRVQERLSWMKDYPRNPSLGIIMRQIETLLELWRGGEKAAGRSSSLDRLRKMSRG